MRKLATIRTVSNIRPIEGKDRIEQVNVDGWNVIVKKDEFKEGDLCVYVEIDSKLPEKPEFEFLKSKKYIIKTMKMSGVRSEGIVFPISILKKKHKLGDEVTKELGITQYNKEVEVKKNLGERIFSYMMRYVWFRKIFKKSISKKKIVSNFPSWIRKTDEERIQNCKQFLSEPLTWQWAATEKVDGSSATYGLKKEGKDFDYIVCSRNNRLYDENNVWARIGIEYNLKVALYNMFVRYEAKNSVVIQGEIINSNIQGNKYKVTEPKFYVFNFIIDGEKKPFTWEDLQQISPRLQPVPMVHQAYDISGKTVDEILEFATFKSRINPDVLAEGLVFRQIDPINKRVLNSFKAVSPEFLMKNNE